MGGPCSTGGATCKQQLRICESEPLLHCSQTIASFERTAYGRKTKVSRRWAYELHCSPEKFPQINPQTTFPTLVTPTGLAVGFGPRVTLENPSIPIHP